MNESIIYILLWWYFMGAFATFLLYWSDEAEPIDIPFWPIRLTWVMVKNFKDVFR